MVHCGFYFGKMCFIDEKFHGDVFLFCAALFPQNLQDLLNMPAHFGGCFSLS